MEVFKVVVINVGYKLVEIIDLVVIKELEVRVIGGKIERGDSVIFMVNEVVVWNKKIGKEDDKKICFCDIVVEIDVRVMRDRLVMSEDVEVVV